MDNSIILRQIKLYNVVSTIILVSSILLYAIMPEKLNGLLLIVVVSGLCLMIKVKIYFLHKQVGLVKKFLENQFGSLLIGLALVVYILIR